MKKFLFFPLLLLVSMSFSQSSEQQEKKQVASGNSRTTSQLPVSSSVELQQKKNIVTQSTPPAQTQRRTEYYPRPNVYSPRYDYFPYLTPFDLRRNYGYYDYPWTRYYQYDAWGFRNYSRVYVIQDGKRDTVHMKPLHGSAGLQFSKGEIGGFLSLGKKVYFLAEYQTTLEKDISTYYPDLSRERALAWGDRRLEDLTKSQVFYVGLGKRYGKTGVHLSLGLGNEKKRYQFEDEYFLLSNNGRYSILNYEDNFVSYKLGVLHNYKKVTLKADIDFYRPKAMIGIGLNF
jgi:hypothetical protein